MFDKKLFASLQKECEAQDAAREIAIKQSRDVLKQSKKAIYSLHRGQTQTAQEFLNEARAGIKDIRLQGEEHPTLLCTGAFLEAQEEFAEASLYYAFILEQPLPSPAALGLHLDEYLAGLCDLVGELVRAAINASLKEDYATTQRISTWVGDLYAELMMFDFRNSPLRRKFDAIKYGLEKLEDLLLNLKLREKIR